MKEEEEKRSKKSESVEKSSLRSEVAERGVNDKMRYHAQTREQNDNKLERVFCEMRRGKGPLSSLSLPQARPSHRHCTSALDGRTNTKCVCLLPYFMMPWADHAHATPPTPLSSQSHRLRSTFFFWGVLSQRWLLTPSQARNLLGQTSANSAQLSYCTL